MKASGLGWALCGVVAICAGCPGQAWSVPEESSASMAWLAAGWDAWDQGKKDLAVARWREGLVRLARRDPDRIVLFAGVFRQRRYAEQTLRRLSRKRGGVMVRGRFQGTKAWYVLAVPSSKAEQDSLRASLRDLLQVRFARGERAADLIARLQNPEAKTRSTSATIDRGRPHREASLQTAASAPFPLDEEKVWKEAVAMLRRGEAEKAMNWLFAALANEVHSHRVVVLAARAAIEAGRPQRALAVLQSAQEEDWRVWFWRGVAHLQLGSLQAAAAALDETLARNGRIAAAWIARAVVAEEEGQWAMAWGLLQNAVSLAPENPSVWLNLGFVAERLGRFREAIEAYRRFLQQDANGAVPWEVRKRVLQRLLLLQRRVHLIASFDQESVR